MNQAAEEEEGLRLENMGEFYEHLKSCRIDREKLEAVDNFLTYGTDLPALETEMDRILKSLIFSHSRTQCLSLLIMRLKAHEDGHGKEDHECLSPVLSEARLKMTQSQHP